jgi:hypothetical protein
LLSACCDAPNSSDFLVGASVSSEWGVFSVPNGGVDGTVIVDDCVVPRDVKGVVELTGSGFDDAGKAGVLGTTADVLTLVAGAASDSGVCENV